MTSVTDPAGVPPEAEPAMGRGTSRHRWASLFPVLLVVLVALVAGGGLLAAASPWGLAASPDSIAYLRAAESFTEGTGLLPGGNPAKLASPHYPPLYPLVLAACARAGGSVLRAGPWLHAALLAANVVLVGALAWRVTARRGCAIAAAAILASSDPFLRAHAWLLSEALFMFSTLAGLLLLERSLRLETPAARRGTLLAAALITGAACVTRYAGLSLLGAGAASVLLYSAGTRRERIVNATSFTLIAVAPLVAWIVRNRYAYDTAVNRELTAIGLRPELGSQLVKTLAEWTLSGMPRPRELLLAAAAAVVASALVEDARRWAGTETAAPPAASRGDDDAGHARTGSASRVLGAFTACYLLLIAVTVLFVDPATPLDSRILLPVQVPLVIGAVAVAGHWTAARAWGPRVVLAMSVAFVTLHAAGSITMLHQLAESGYGFTARAWVESPTLRYAATLPPGMTFYSNTPEPIMLHLDRSVARLPRVGAKPSRGGSSPDAYARQLRAVARRLRETDGAVIWFDRTSRATIYESEKQLARKLRLVRVARFSDGAIYRAAPPPPGGTSVTREAPSTRTR